MEAGLNSLGGHGVAILELSQVALVVAQPLLVAGDVDTRSAQLLQLSLQLQITTIIVRSK